MDRMQPNRLFNNRFILGIEDATGTPTNNINVPFILVSDLQIAFANTTAVGGLNTNSQRLTFGGGDVTVGAQTITVSGGYTVGLKLHYHARGAKGRALDRIH